MRGTPQQIIEKYNQLARDSQLSGDRVATENFQQHAEHYTRMLAEAMREQEARREQQEAQHRERQQQHQQNPQHNEARNERQPQDRGSGDQPQPQSQPQAEPARTPKPAPEATPQPGLDLVESSTGVIDVESEESGLVETPESKPAPKPRTRRPRKPAAPKGGGEASSDAPEAAE